MKTEETFDIVIDDSEAEKCRMPRDVIDIVMRKVGRTDQAACLTQRSFQQLRRTFRELFGINRADFRLDNHLEKLVPLVTRKIDLIRISERINCDISGELTLPRPMVFLILTVSAALGSLVVFSAWGIGPILAMTFGVIVIVVVAKIGLVLTRGLRTRFPRKLQTVRDLTRWLVAHNPRLVNAPPGQWSREQVAERIRDIVVDVLGCEKAYREDARFVEDLGLS